MTIDTPGVRSNGFREPGDPPANLVMNIMLFGIDGTEIIASVRNRLDGWEPTPEEIDAMGKRSVTGRP